MDKKKKGDITNNRKISEFMTKKNIKEEPKNNATKISTIHQLTNAQKQNKKKHPKVHTSHPSSREGSGDETEELPSVHEEQVKQVCMQFVLIGPCDVRYYTSIKTRIQNLLKNYTKKNFIQFVAQNAKYSRIRDLKNLDRIHNDEFWSRVVPTMLEYVNDERVQKKISACVEMLPRKQSKVISLTKFQVFLILTNMFMCIMPRQSHTNNLSFCHLMSSKEHDTEGKLQCRYQKLLCIVNYFVQITKIKRENLQNQQIEIQRVKGSGSVEQIREIAYQLKDVQIRDGLIQDYHSDAILVDFANKCIGGGVLDNGAVQEEILFVGFPELICTMALCPPLQDEEALIVYDAKRFNDYEGYSYDFKYKGNVYGKKSGGGRSVFVAIDAVDYKKAINEKHQYLKHYVDRELIKAQTGFEGAEMGAQSEMWICTGRWGCGAFAGDGYLKFLIQWIAASLANRNMVYIVQEEEEIKQLRLMVGFLKNYCTNDILEVIQEYAAFKQRQKLSFLQFVKEFI